MLDITIDSAKVSILGNCMVIYSSQETSAEIPKNQYLGLLDDSSKELYCHFTTWQFGSSKKKNQCRIFSI